MLKQYKSPPIYQIDQIHFPLPETILLSNGIPVYLIEGGSQDVCKIDFMFDAGRPYEHKRLTATTLAGIIKEGTKTRSAHLIAEETDHCGASISSPFSFDHIHLQLVCLTKHVLTLLPILIDIAREPVFEESELQLFKKRTLQRLAVDLSHNDVVCYRKATELYFGPEHPYGYNSSQTAYLDVQREDLIQHHTAFFGPQNAKIFVAGRLPHDLVSHIEMLTSDWPSGIVAGMPVFPDPVQGSGVVVDDLNKAQSALRIGRPLFNRNHPDWPGVFLLNTILGGYFGSRLMKNIREKKGLTYGVQSTLESLKFHGYLSISLETERQQVGKVIREIFKEIDILQQSRIPDAELQMAKNYTGGYLLSLMDGPLQILEVLKNNIAEDSPINFTEQLLKKLSDTTADTVMALAQRYLNKEDLYQVIIH
ncbi:MAG: insulinase family protein [Saprospiraceae bacterium]|nr:insulinase family protein [Saprospiraceae bacterium]